MKLNTRRIGKELTMVSVEILILRFLKPEIKLKHYHFFSYILISLPDAVFFLRSVYIIRKIEDLPLISPFIH